MCCNNNYSRIHLFGPTSLSLLPQLCVCFYFFPLLNVSSSVCVTHTLLGVLLIIECSQSIMGYTLKWSWLFLTRWLLLPIVLQPEVALCAHIPFSLLWRFSGFSLCRSYVHCHNHRELMCPTALLYLEDDVPL